MLTSYSRDFTCLANALDGILCKISLYIIIVKNLQVLTLCLSKGPLKKPHECHMI